MNLHLKINFLLLLILQLESQIPDQSRTVHEYTLSDFALNKFKEDILV